MRQLGTIAAWIGGVGSTVLIVYAGRHYAHPFVLVLFVFWAVAPFAGYGLLVRLSARWPSAAPVGLDSVIELAAIASLVVYTYAIVRPGRAVPFVVVPLVSWALILSVLAIGALKSGPRA